MYLFCFWTPPETGKHCNDEWTLRQTAYVESFILPQGGNNLHGQCPCIRDKFHVCIKCSETSQPYTFRTLLQQPCNKTCKVLQIFKPGLSVNMFLLLNFSFFSFLFSFTLGTRFHTNCINWTTMCKVIKPYNRV